MIKHLVMWKLKDVAEGGTKEQNARKMKTDLEALKHKIPQIRHIEVGANFLPSDFSYDVALYSEFQTEEDLALYQKHPDHRSVGAFVQKVSEKRTVVDYKTSEKENSNNP
jgi:Stress responsive A/B Barrel Domain